MKISKSDYALIRKIAERANTIEEGALDTMSTQMDLECVHESTPLRLKDMLKADDFNLCHDVFGIARHLNRETRQLENCFVPRFTK